MLSELFEEVQLVRSGKFPRHGEGGFVPWHHDMPAVTDGGDRYWLWLVLRTAAVDAGTFRPIGQETPVGSIEQYPPSVTKPFLDAYVATALFAPIPVAS